MLAHGDAVADDLLARELFRPDERRVLEHVRTTVEAPSTIRELIARRRRVHLGNRQATVVAGVPASTATTAREVLAQLPRRPLAALVYVGVTVVTRALAAADRRRGVQTWGRGSSSG